MYLQNPYIFGGQNAIFACPLAYAIQRVHRSTKNMPFGVLKKKI